jgi:hypothetical protein
VTPRVVTGPIVQLPLRSADTSYLGYPIRVTDDGYVVTGDGTRVPFKSMRTLRAFVKTHRREMRTVAAPAVEPKEDSWHSSR